jgi:hypothetical protein
MSGDDFLETLQADLVAILKATPSLADVNIIPEDDGDMEAKIMRGLGTLKGGSTNKAGSVAVVMLPAVTEAEANLPGPPLTVSVKVQVIEQSVVNRAAAGSGVRSSEGALRVLNALHHHSLAYAVLYAGRNPVEPVDVKKGYLSHMVTLTLQFRGLQGPGKVAALGAVTGAGDTITVSGTLTSNGVTPLVFPALVRAPDQNGKAAYSDTGTWDFENTLFYLEWQTIGEVGRWSLYALTSGAQWVSASDVATPNAAENWTALGTETGTPVLTLNDTIVLSCATAGAAIHYTTDGSYPTPSNGTLYTEPFTLPAAGTVIRAAAYKTGLNPGNVTELLITE